MHDFGQTLHDACLANIGRRLVLYKDDVVSAFLNLPAHPLWQICQIAVVDGKLQIVRRLVFGNRASPCVWSVISGLICWIAIWKFLILDLFVYMDDFYGWDYEDDMIFYHGQWRPNWQVMLLRFWEYISCPFDDEKQKHGRQLKIIGFWVNIEDGSISLSPSSVTDILEKINQFILTPNWKSLLRDWQCLAGHLNWLLNVLPWGHPALSELYHKISRKSHPSHGVFINAKVKSNLTRLASIIPRSIGVRFVDSGQWPDSGADLIVWTDVSLHLALSFVYGNNGFLYQLRKSPLNIKIDIFFLELVAIMSAIHHVASFASPPKRLLIFTDSLDAMAVFNSLHTNETIHNGPLLGVASVILCTGIDLRVCHIKGKQNIQPDLLSRLLLEEFASKFPSYRVCLFDPPHDLLPARWRECF